MTQSIKKISGISGIALVALMVLVLPQSFAHATDLDGGDGGWDTTGFTDYTAPSSNYGGWDTTGYTDYAAPSSNYGGWDTTGYTDYTAPSYTGYTAGGYATGGYSTGGYSTGGGYMIGGGHAYNTPVPTPAPVAPSNTSVCSNSANSCNHDDHSVVNITNPAPVINNNNVVVGQTQAPVQQYCAAGYYGTYPNCYRPAPIAPVVAYNQAPYVSLSQVPYTGLDLGFWGTIAYWGFMVAFALFAAYLIAIKRVQNGIAAWMKEFLFGTDEAPTVARVVTRSTVVTAPAAPAPASANSDAIDPFILSQINRRNA